MMDTSKELWEQIQDTFSKLESEDKAFAENIAYQFMITRIYAEFETTLEKLFHTHMQSNNTFTNEYINNNKIHRGLSIEDISSILRKMKLLNKNEKLVSNEISQKHLKFLDIRHPMTHEGSNIDSSILPISTIIDNCITILNAILAKFNVTNSNDKK